MCLKHIKLTRITEILGINDNNLVILGNEKATSIAISLLWILKHILIDFLI